VQTPNDGREATARVDFWRGVGSEFLDQSLIQLNTYATRLLVEGSTLHSGEPNFNLPPEVASGHPTRATLEVIKAELAAKRRQAQQDGTSAQVPNALWEKKRLDDAVGLTLDTASFVGLMAAVHAGQIENHAAATYNSPGNVGNAIAGMTHLQQQFFEAFPDTAHA
jgi:hypothetical protein